jgi:conjugative relaxase-like TrwC/TraI family protein
MLRASKALTLHQAATYYTSEYARGDYYTGAAGSPGSPAESPGVWRGQAAADLGVAGPVERGDFHELLTGHLRGVQLVAPETATGVHRAAWDFTVAPDKTVSLVALVGGDERVVAAHRAAADAAFAVLERHAQAKDRSRQLVATGNLLAARFDHDASRSLDPQLHSHHVVFNLTRRPDGAWRALESRSLFRVQSLATATYHLELARELQALGYDIRVDAPGHVRIAGIPEPARRHFSQRRREILAALARQQGVKDPQRAALATRLPKDHGVDRETLRRTWAAAAEKLGIDFAALRREAAARLAAGRGRPAAPTDAAAQAERSAAWAVEHLSERQATFTARELETAALRHSTGRGPAAAEVRAALAAHPDLFPGAGDRLTTRAALRLEAANLDLMRQARAERRPPIVPAPWQAPDLAPDQLRVARHILESPAQLLAVEGKPGTGKTHTLARVREVASSHGWTVRGFAVTTGAVEELRKVGIDAATVKSLEHQPLPSGTSGTALAAGGRQLWIVDEAGLLGNRDAGTLLARARLADARAVLVGDRRQHHAVAAGKPFVDLQQAGLEAVRLDAIRRQRNPEILAAVRLTSEGRAAQAVDHLARHGYVTEIRAARDRHQAMARAFVAAPPGTLMIAPSHAERTALNGLARRLLLAEGRVAPAGVAVEVAVSKSLTGAQRTDVRHYQPGDLVTFHRGSPTRRLRAGEAARVVAVDPDRHLVTVERLRPRGGAATLEYDPRRLRGVDVARVERRELAAGDRIVFRRPHRAAGVANGAAARVLRVEPGGPLEIELDRRPGKPVVLDHREAPLPLDHGYAVTSHAAQGRTVHTVLATIDVEHSPELVNRQQLNVTVSRATHGLHLFTNDRAALPAAVQREAPKTSARELLRAERSPARAPGQGPDPARATVQPAGPAGHAGRRRPEPAAGVIRPSAPPDRERARARGAGAADRRRADRPLLARAADADRRPGPELHPRRRALRPPDPPRDPLRGPARGAPGGGGRRPGDASDPRRHGAEDRLPRRAAGPVPARLKERLEDAWARWQSWRAERDAVARDAQALRIELARLRAAAPAARPGGPASAIPTLAARLAVLKSRLAALTRARDPEELLLRTVRQIGVSRALALLPRSAAPVVLGLRLGARVLTSLVRDR